jgi:amino acid transporter
MSAGETASNIEEVGKTRLQRNALSLGAIVASTLALIAPAASFFFGFAVIVQGAGLAAVLTIFVAMVVILFLTNTVAQFSRFTPSAGSCVTFTGKAFGPAVGAAVAVFTNFGFIVLASAFLAGAGAWVAETLKTYSAVSVPWAVMAVLISLSTGWLVVRGVALSAFWAGIFFHFEVGLLTVAAAVIMATHANYLTVGPFLFANLAGGLTGLGAGFPLAIFLFIGWDNSAPLAEETEKPRRNIPRALVACTLSIGLFYIFLAYATAVGFNMDAQALGTSQNPFIAALGASAPALLIVAYLAGVTSFLSGVIAGTNSFARILFNSGREGLLPEICGKVQRCTGRPTSPFGLSSSRKSPFSWDLAYSAVSNRWIILGSPARSAPSR